MNTIDVCFSPTLYPMYHDKESLVVVVDVFRATTTMAAAFQNGARSIRPVATVEEAETYKKRGWLVGAERNVERCQFADFGNSPFDYSNEKVAGKDIVLTTTNGTKAITMAKAAKKIIIGAFVNLQAVADYCLYTDRNVIVLCSGWQDKVNIEDTLFGGALVDLLVNSNHFSMGSDAAKIALDMWRSHQTDLLGYLETIDHMDRLKAHHLEESVPYCLTLNCVDKVPELSEENDSLILKVNSIHKRSHH